MVFRQTHVGLQLRQPCDSMSNNKCPIFRCPFPSCQFFCCLKYRCRFFLTLTLCCPFFYRPIYRRRVFQLSNVMLPIFPVAVIFVAFFRCLFYRESSVNSPGVHGVSSVLKKKQGRIQGVSRVSGHPLLFRCLFQLC